jgi:peptidoglycan/LPS O-acetylase OafA/YrhL
LRGFAALGVVIAHYHYNGFLTGVPIFKYAGQYMIWLFFFLSSFLLSHSLETALSRGGPAKAIFNYAINRVFRIFPMLLLTVFLTRYFSFAYFHPPRLLVDPVTHAAVLEDASLQRAILNVLTIGRAPNVLWTIPIEFTFYIVLPFHFLFLRLVRRLPQGEIVVALWFAAWCLVVEFLTMTGARNSFVATLGIHHYVNFLFGGVVGYMVLFPERGSSGAPTRIARVLLPLAPLAFPIFVLLFPYYTRGLPLGDFSLSGMPDEADRQAYHDAVFPWMPMLIGVIFVRLMYAEKSPLTLLFKTRFFQLLGFASFSLYLLHVPILELWRAYFGLGMLQLVLCLAVTVAVSWLCAAMVEQTFIDLGKRLNLA